MGEHALPAQRVALALGAATCRVLKGGIVHLDDVGGMMAFKKIRDKQGKLVDTLAFQMKMRLHMTTNASNRCLAPIATTFIDGGDNQ